MTLHELALRHGTDKAKHGYTDFYESNFDRSALLRVLEIGVKRGASLRMWRDWLPDAVVEGWDIRPVEVEGCATQVVDATDRDQMAVASSVYDLILDDASHTMRGQQIALSYLFPRCRVFVMEDLHTSLRAQFYGKGDVSTLELIEGLPGSWASPHASAEESAYISRHAEVAATFASAGRVKSAIIVNRDPELAR